MTLGINVGKRARGSRTLVAALAVSVVASLAVVAAPAVAGAEPLGPVSLMQLTTGTTGVSTTTHTHLHFVVSVLDRPSDPTYESYVTLALSKDTEISHKKAAGSESHTWQFTIPTSALALTSTGATLDVPTADISPYGELRLKITNVGTTKAPVVCGDGNQTTTQPVSVTGEVLFNTRSTGRLKWGEFGHKTDTYKFHSGSILKTSYGTGAENCDGYATQCYTGVGAVVASFTSLMDAGTSGKTGVIDDERAVELAKPKGATRTDAVAGTAKVKFTMLSDTMADAAVTVPKIGTISGSYTVIDKLHKPTKQTMTCSRGSVHSIEHIELWDPAAYADGSPGIAFHESVFGTLTFKNGTANEITQISRYTK
jgi:hypothetical protein